MINKHLVSRYTNISLVTDGANMPLANIIADIRNGYCRDAVERARQAYQRHGKQSKAYTQAKGQLEYFTPGGVFSRRSSDGLVQSSGLLQGDIDQLPPSELAYARTSLITDPHTIYCFTSPSGAGLKFAFAIESVGNNASYRRYFDALTLYMRIEYGLNLDLACKSISHPCYLSYDPEAYYYPEAKRLPPPAQPSPLINNRPAPPPNIRPETNTRQFNYALNRIATAQPGERHDTRIKMARLIGGLIAGGQLDTSAAILLTETAAAHSDKPKAAKRDIADGLRYGRESPLYPENRSLRDMYQREARGSRLYHG